MTKLANDYYTDVFPLRTRASIKRIVNDNFKNLIEFGFQSVTREFSDIGNLIPGAGDIVFITIHTGILHEPLIFEAHIRKEQNSRNLYTVINTDNHNLTHQQAMWFEYVILDCLFSERPSISYNEFIIKILENREMIWVKPLDY